MTQNTTMERRPTRRAAAMLLTGVLLTGAKALRAPPALAEDVVSLEFARLYAKFGVRGFSFSEFVTSAAGRKVALSGYMAPPMKTEAAFFVLTREPLAICPFCQSDADWPADIVVVLLKEASPLVSGGAPVRVEGRLEIGSKTDADTGFVSQIRIVDAAFRRQH